MGVNPGAVGVHVEREQIKLDYRERRKLARTEK